MSLLPSSPPVSSSCANPPEPRYISACELDMLHMRHFPHKRRTSLASDTSRKLPSYLHSPLGSLSCLASCLISSAFAWVAKGLTGLIGHRQAHPSPDPDPSAPFSRLPSSLILDSPPIDLSASLSPYPSACCSALSLLFPPPGSLHPSPRPESHPHTPYF